MWALLLFCPGDLRVLLPDRLLHDPATDRPDRLDGRGAARDGSRARARPAVHLRGAGAHRPGQAGERRAPGLGGARSRQLGAAARDVRELQPPGGWEAPPPAGHGLPGLSGAGLAPRGTGAVTAATPPPPPTPRAWLADPGGRHELRYWDGTKFTEHVADGGQDQRRPALRAGTKASLGRGRQGPSCRALGPSAGVYSLSTCWAKGVPAISRRCKPRG